MSSEDVPELVPCCIAVSLCSTVLYVCSLGQHMCMNAPDHGALHDHVCISVGPFTLFALDGIWVRVFVCFGEAVCGSHGLFRVHFFPVAMRGGIDLGPSSGM